MRIYMLVPSRSFMHIEFLILTLWLWNSGFFPQLEPNVSVVFSKSPPLGAGS